MKVLVVHNFHRKGSASGDDQVYNNEIRLLEQNGNEVIKYSVNNSEFDDANPIKKLTLTVSMIWSFKHYRRMKKLIKKEQPDIVHIHSFFPLLSPSIFYAVKRMHKPVVATLHDSRLFCPCATSLKDGDLCSLCKDGKYFRMTRYGCYQNSRIKSFVVALVFKIHRIKGTFNKKIDRYICLNEQQIQLLVESGIDRNKITKKYNFTDRVKCESSISGLPERYVSYFGRLGQEKGIRVLMDIWNLLDDITLVVMGVGPLEDEFKEWLNSHKNVVYLGFVEHSKCMSIVKKSEFVVCPSICYEGCAMAEIEAESVGKPVIGPDLGFFDEAIVDGYNGYKAKVGNALDFATKIKMLWNEHNKIEEMGANASKDYEVKYSPEENYRQLREVYEKAKR